MTPFDFIFNTVLYILLLIFVFYFFIIKPTRDKELAQEKLLKTLKKNVSVITTGGIHGKVFAVGEQLITVEIAPNVKIKVEPAHVVLKEQNDDSSK